MSATLGHHRGRRRRRRYILAGNASPLAKVSLLLFSTGYTVLIASIIYGITRSVVANVIGWITR